jgi:nitroreductase
LGWFLHLAAGLSAWKSLDGARWSLRTRPSSGNLHPTETTLILFANSDDISDQALPAGIWDQALPAGVYHYDTYAHALECRRAFSPQTVEALKAAYPAHWGCLGLSSVPWREEWKYGARAFRYCQLDVGHAIGSAQAAALVAFASAKDHGVSIDPRPTDAQVSALLGLDQALLFADAEPEHPDLLAWLGAAALPDLAPLLLACAADPAPWHGSASRASAESLQWPEVALAEAATVKRDALAPYAVAPAVSAAAPWLSAEIIMQRRSAQRMDPQGEMDAAGFAALLGRLNPAGGDPLWQAFPFAPAIELLLMVHAVEGLEPGLYLYRRAEQRWPDLSARLGETPEPLSAYPGLFRLGAARSLRKEASQLSCYQGLAGRGAVAWVMLADMGGVLAAEGAWAYRRLHWEAGLIGQILYLSAEASGLRGTGIGCFMDAQSAALALGEGVVIGTPSPWQTLYHFTIGKPLEDDRLSSEPPYAHVSPPSLS